MRIDPVKGTRDFYPDKMRFRNWFFETCRRVSLLFGYEEYDGPFLELLELYARKSGEELVNEQTYTLTSRGDDPETLAIRPEMTPTLARMVAARQQEIRKPIRWFSIPNCWRYEAPQRGRRREFNQYNVDILGVESLDADAEILAVTVRILRELGLEQGEFVIRISNRYYLETLFQEIGASESVFPDLLRQIDRIEKLKPEEFCANLLELGLATLQVDALLKRLNDRSYAGFEPLEQLFEKLEQYGIADYTRFDPHIARGLLYYTGTVFEIWDQSKNLRRAVAGGGRYDDLVTDLGGTRLPGVGIAFSDVVIEQMLEQRKKAPVLPREIDIYVAQYQPTLRGQAIAIAQSLREAGFRTEMNVLDVGLDKQLKAAAAGGAQYAIILAPDEMARGEVNVKNLRTREQLAVPMEGLATFLSQNNDSSLNKEV
ncbi:MAG TPA: histidine--tRNA ligase [Armatimonadota bacterium]|nr:histidine--tRNA ligase [Armatimonadota bacterium]